MENKANDNKRKIRLGLPLLIGAAGALTFCFFSVTEVFAGNRAELLFNLKDFVWWILLAAVCVTVIVAVLIAVPRGKASRIIGWTLYICAIIPGLSMLTDILTAIRSDMNGWK